MQTSEDNQDRFRRPLLTGGVADCRGRSQYGLLQYGQTFGSWCLSRGTHSCPHRSQRYPQICTFGIGAIYPREEYTSSMCDMGVDRLYLIGIYLLGIYKDTHAYGS